MEKDKNSKRFYVYGHFTENGEIFYIGVGTKSMIQTDKVIRLYPRAYHFNNRNNFWNNIKNKYGIVVKILSTHETKEESLEEERKLISKYGRRCINRGGCLTNISLGGEIGPVGRIFIMKQKQKDLLSKIRSQTFYVYHKNGRFLKEIKTIKNTADFCGVTYNAVWSCFKTKNYTNGYFVFREYKGEKLPYTYKDLDFGGPNKVRVSSESEEGIITEHDSLTDCAEFLNRSRKSVSGAMKRGGKCNKHKIVKL